MTAQVIDLRSRQMLRQERSLALVPQFTPVLSEDELVDLYLRGYDPGTRKEYARDIEQYRKFLDEDGGFGIDLYEAVESHAGDWKQFQFDTMEYAPAGVRRRMTSVRRLYVFAMAGGYFNRNPFHAVKLPKVSNNVQYTGLNLQDVRALAEGIRYGCDLQKRVLNFGLMTTGLRVSEFLNSNVEDARLENGKMRLRVIRKGGNTDEVEFPRGVSAQLVELIGERRRGPIMVGSRGGRLARQVAWRIVRNAGDRFLPHLAGKLHPHDYRHGFVSGVLLVTGGDIREAKWRASHADMNNTIRYAHQLERAESTTVDDLESAFGISV